MNMSKMIQLRNVPDSLHLGRMWDFPNNVSAYDATYVALAEDTERVAP
jgi:predicted nucleic acid-binding protein